MNRNDVPHSESPAPAPESEAQLRALITLFNWLIGEVVTARIMNLRLAADLIRCGAIEGSDLFALPLAKEMIDHVLAQFPRDPMWDALHQRVRSSLEQIRHNDLAAQAQAPQGAGRDDLEEGDLNEGDLVEWPEAESLAPASGEVMYAVADGEPRFTGRAPRGRH